jgi:hypothetical protein
MPRNITVTLADGRKHVYANTPDNVTPGQVTARAVKEFGVGVTNVDGGKPAPTVRTAAPTVRPSVRNAFGLGAPPPKGTQERQVYDAEYNKRFNADWLAAHPAEARKRKAQAGGRELSQTHSSGSGMGDALLAGIRAVPGVNYLSALGMRYLPSAITGNHSNASVGDIMETLTARNDADYDKSATGYWTGAIAGGGGASKLLSGGVRAVSRAGVPIISGLANTLQRLTTLNKGQRAANAAKVVASGAGWGGASALDTNRNPVVGAVEGAVGGAVLGGSLKVAQVLSRPVRDFLRTSSAGRILSRFTSSTADEIAAKAAAYRQATGAEPTVFELLPLADRNKILKQGVVGRDNIVEQTSNAIRARAENLGPEMRSLAERTTAPSRRFVERGVETDLTRARGGAPDPADPALVGRASRSPTDMLELRDTEARAIMAPHEQTPVAADFAELLPQHPQNVNGTIVMQDADPMVTAAIRSAVPSGFRPAGQGVTAGDIADMISTLRGDLGKGGIEARTAQRAIDHLTGVLDDAAPDAGVAARQMTDAYAGRSRMAEGMQEGGRTRMRDDVEVGTSRRAARTVRNAYDTPEGAAGRTLGQANRIVGDLSGAPEDALKATIRMARGTSGRAMAQNLGPREADAIMAGARAQDASAQALSAASQTATGGNSGALDAEGLVQALVGLHPSSFATTKAGAIRKLLDMTYVPESRARAMVEMLFSQDPALTAKAIKAIGNSPNGTRAIKALARLAGQAAGPMENDAANAPQHPGGGLTPQPTSFTDTLDGEASGPVFMVEENPPGLVEPGNIDLSQREPVDNGDGTYSTVLSFSIQTEDGEVLLPLVVDGQVVSEDEAIKHFQDTGEHLGIFDSPEAADAYAAKLHDQQAGAYDDQAGGGEQPSQGGYADPGGYAAGDVGEAVPLDPNIPYGRQIIERIFPGVVHVTEDVRDPKSRLGRANPGSYHNKSQNAVDVRPIPGMTFNQFLTQIKQSGHEIIEARDEVNNPSGHATGPHWHVVIA